MINDFNKNDSITIYAELNRKQYGMLIDGDARIEIPYGTTFHNKSGRRQLWFTCEDEEVAKELEEGLDESGINWQRV